MTTLTSIQFSNKITRAACLGCFDFMWETMPEFDASLEVQPTFPLLTCFWQCRHLTSRKSPPTISKWVHHKLWGRPLPGILEIFKLSNPQKNLGRVRSKGGCNKWCQNTGIAKKGRGLTLPEFVGPFFWPNNKGCCNRWSENTGIAKKRGEGFWPCQDLR